MLACLVLVLVVLASVSAIEYTQIQGLNSRLGTTPSTITSTTTVTQIVNEGQLCDIGGSLSNSPSAHDTNCQESITLYLGIGNTTLKSGANLTISLSVRNNVNSPRQINTTGFPLLPSGANPNNGGYYYYYTLPGIPVCGLSPVDAPVPAFVMIYNSSGDPLFLNNPSSGIPVTLSVSTSGSSTGTFFVMCLSLGPPTYSFAASQALSTTINVGGYWSVPRQGGTPLQGVSGYQHFSPGKYTLVAFDAFGDSVVLPFTVTSG